MNEKDINDVYPFKNLVRRVTTVKCRSDCSQGEIYASLLSPPLCKRVSSCRVDFRGCKENLSGPRKYPRPISMADLTFFGHSVSARPRKKADQKFELFSSNFLINVSFAYSDLLLAEKALPKLIKNNGLS